MQSKVFLSLVAAGLLLTPAAFAQSGKEHRSSSKEETVVIKRNSPKTVIEIKNGKVYVNGDAVVTINDKDADQISKKIIIENDGKGGDGGSANSMGESFEFPQFDMNDAPAAKRPMLGVLTDPKAEGKGALVKEVTPGSPAEKAGIKAGDRITRLDGKAINDAQKLINEVTSHEIGDKVAVQYERNGQNNSASVELAAAPSQNNTRIYHFGPNDMQQGNLPNSFFKEFHFPAMDGMMETRPKLGVSVEDRADGNGVTVLSVSPSSAAAKAGIREGDVITKVGDDKVSSANDLVEQISNSKPGERIGLKYERNGREASADVILPRPLSKRDL